MSPVGCGPGMKSSPGFRFWSNFDSVDFNHETLLLHCSPVSFRPSESVPLLYDWENHEVSTTRQNADDDFYTKFVQLRVL